MDILSFDDLLAEKPKKRTSIAVKSLKPPLAKRYIPPESRDTPAKWDTPAPECVILFWSETRCKHCKTVHSHPTYQQNTTMVRYRVSRFRTVLRPYLYGDERKYKHLPKVKETTKFDVHYCDNCFHEHTLSLADFDFVGPPAPIGKCFTDIVLKPFIEIDDEEIARMRVEAEADEEDVLR